VKVDGKLAMAVIPADERCDLECLKKVVGAKKVELASEKEFWELFPGCEVGAMPPFGNLYGIATYVASALAEDEEIAFNSGTHTELVKMKYADFAKLVEVEVAPISR
jgi:Ala-tRNA(Pro) deacylase